MRTKPSIPYSGLTIVIDKPSRFDEKLGHLISAKAGEFIQDCIQPVALDSVDIRDTFCHDDFISNTTHIALLGKAAAEKYNGNIQKHGYPFYMKGIRATIAFFPQDCCDHYNIEFAQDDDDDDTNERETKEKSPTRRSSYRFWTKWHIRKLLSPLKAEPVPIILPYPNIENLVKWLSSLHDQDLYLDIETSRQHQCLTCIGLSSSSLFPQIYVVPIYLHTGQLAYPNFSRIYKALSLALLRNTVVIHNASFDLTILHGFYKFPLPTSIYDTMLANHRIFSDVEKSLAHVIAQWTQQPYHKDQNTEAWSEQTQRSLWQYNGRDVFNLKLIKNAQLAYASEKPGLLASIDQVNQSINPYLTNTFTGLRLDRYKLAAKEVELSRSAKQYTRIVRILTGDNNFNPGSPDQCRNYFHKKLDYPIMAYTPANAAKLGKKQFYQLLLKTNNPVISAILKYRKVAKDASMLESPLWTTK